MNPPTPDTPPSPSLLSAETFLTVVRHAPLVSLDLICRNPAGQVLLGLRQNRPAQGFWFVPGGRILKDERVPAALARILRNELGLAEASAQSLPTLEPLGVFEHHYRDNFAQGAGETEAGGAESLSGSASTHYLVLAYQLTLADGQGLRADAQHSALRWFSPAELLASPQVHDNTKAYFQAGIGNTRIPGYARLA